MKAATDGDRVIGFIEGDVDGLEVPAALSGLPAGRLFIVDNEVVDGATMATFFVDQFGRKHAIHAHNYWQPIVCKWSDALVQKGGAWVVSDDDEARRATLFGAGAVPEKDDQ